MASSTPQNFDTIVGEVLKLGIDQLAASHPQPSFYEAFTDVPGYKQRDVEGGRQVLHDETEVNFVLKERSIIILVKDEDLGHFAELVARTLSKRLKVEINLEALADEGSEHLMRYQKISLPDSISTYEICLRRRTVFTSASDRDSIQGVHIILNYSQSAGPFGLRTHQILR